MSGHGLVSGKRSGLDDSTLPDRSAELSSLPELEKQFDVQKETAELLKTPERAQRLAQLAELGGKEKELIGNVAVLSTAKQGFLVRQNQLIELANSARTACEAADTAMKLSRTQVPADILDSHVAEFMASLLAEKTPGAHASRIPRPGRRTEFSSGRSPQRAQQHPARAR